MLREIYFYLYYDISLFEEKPEQARRNYRLYERKIYEFFDEVCEKDRIQFIEKKKTELKQRSIHLKGYLLDYEKEPVNMHEKRLYLLKIVCIFDQILRLCTESKHKEMKKKRLGKAFKSESQQNKPEPIYLSYISNQYKKPNNSKVKVFSG